MEKTKEVEKNVIVELGESQPWSTDCKPEFFLQEIIFQDSAIPDIDWVFEIPPQVSAIAAMIFQT